MAVGWRYSNLSCIMKQDSGATTPFIASGYCCFEIIWNNWKSPGIPNIASGYWISWKNYKSPKHQILQVDTELVKKIQRPPNTKYCKWMLYQFQKLQVPMSQILLVDNWTTKKFHKSPTHHLLQVATEHSKKIQTTSQVFNSSDLSSWQDKSPSQKA